MNALALALHWGAYLAHYKRNPTEVERLASELIELSTRHNFSYWLAIGTIFCGWVRSASGDTGRDAEDLLKGRHPSITTHLKPSRFINHWSSVLSWCHHLHVSNSSLVET